MLKYGYLIMLIFLSACSPGSETGTEDVRWDRDACERCRMVLSDPHFAVQIRYFPPGKHSKIAKFDDIGCAVTWLHDKPWENDNKTEIWVADHRTRNWINARTAVYVPRKTTPMEYGLGAQVEMEPGAINFEQARLHIADIEKRFNIHGKQNEQQNMHQHTEMEKSQ